MASEDKHEDAPAADAVDESAKEKADAEAPLVGEDALDALTDEDGLPLSGDSHNPLPLAAVYAATNMAEGDEIALPENAYQEQVLKDAEGQPSGLTSVEEAMNDDLQASLDEQKKARDEADA